MPVVFDAVLVAALARELESRLRNARLRAIRLDRAGRALSLLFREGTLRFALHPDGGDVAWHDPVDPEPGDRPAAGRLQRIRAISDDRVLRLEFLRSRGSPPTLGVIVEWVTGRWNAVVVEGGSEGADGSVAIVRHVLVEIEGEGAPRVGYRWAAPRPSTRAGADGDLTLHAWADLLRPVEPRGRKRALLGAVAWTSPRNADALLGAAARGEDEEAERALLAGHALWRELAAVALGRRAAEPVLIRAGATPQPYPLPLPGAEAERTTTLLEAFARVGAAGAGPPTVPEALLDALRGRGVRAWARVESLERELAEAPDPAALRSTGDLLLARIAEVPRGKERVTLEDFLGAPVEIALDPTLAPNENAAAWYERASRAERARERLPRMIGEARAEAARIEEMVEAALRGEIAPDAIRAELPAATPDAAPDAAPTLPYRVYRSSGGLEIRVGRGARHNDDLTFHHAAPDDVWLHARHAAGAHVVLRWTGPGNPPARDLGEAAVLAALASKARGARTVPVDWTRRKYVRKPRKSSPGEVAIDRVKTLFVEPDPAIEERLRER